MHEHISQELWNNNLIILVKKDEHSQKLALLSALQVK